MQQKKIVSPTEPERHELVRNAKSDSKLPKIDDKRNNNMKMPIIDLLTTHLLSV